MKRQLTVDDEVELSAEEVDEDIEENLNEENNTTKRVVEEWERVKVHAISHYRGDIQ